MILNYTRYNQCLYLDQNPSEEKIRIDIPSYEESPNSKECNNTLRWNLVFNVLLLTIVPLPLWLPFASMEVSEIMLPGIQVIFTVCWLTVSVLSWATYFKLWMTRKKTFILNKTYQHLIVLSAYKEPVSLLISTIESIEIQNSAACSINLNISFEERTPELRDGFKKLKFLSLLNFFFNLQFSKINLNIFLCSLCKKQFFSRLYLVKKSRPLEKDFQTNSGTYSSRFIL